MFRSTPICPRRGVTGSSHGRGTTFVFPVAQTSQLVQKLTVDTDSTVTPQANTDTKKRLVLPACGLTGSPKKQVQKSGNSVQGKAHSDRSPGALALPAGFWELAASGERRSRVQPSGLGGVQVQEQHKHLHGDDVEELAVALCHRQHPEPGEAEHQEQQHKAGSVELAAIRGRSKQDTRFPCRGAMSRRALQTGRPMTVPTPRPPPATVLHSAPLCLVQSWTPGRCPGSPQPGSAGPRRQPPAQSA